MHGFDLIFLALVAGALIFRLYNTLGKEDDATHERIRAINKDLEQELRDVSADRAQTQVDASVMDDLRRFPADEQKIIRTFHEQWPGFSPQEFLEGAKKAYIFIVEAFARGDKKELKGLLSSVLYSELSTVIDKRAKKGETHEHNVHNVSRMRFIQANLRDSQARITLDLQTFQTHKTTNKNGETLYETGEDLEEMWDRWTFTKDITQATPRWILVNIEATPPVDRKTDRDEGSPKTVH